MKNLVKELTKKLNSKGRDLNITGQELMKVFNIKATEIRRYCEEQMVELYDNFWIESHIQYVHELEKEFLFDDSVYWYENPDDEYPKYETSDLNTKCEDCQMFTGSIYRKGSFEEYSISLLEMVDIIKNIVKDEPIKLTLVYLVQCLVMIEIDKNGICNVKYEITDFPELTKEEKDILLYQLIVLSYNQQLKETLKALKLM